MALLELLAESTPTIFYGVAVINALLAASVIAVLVSWAAKPPFWNTLKNHLQTYGLHYAFWTALLSTAGSLWLSLIAGYTPCNLCWYQRIAMYPLVAVLGVGLWKQYRTRITGLILAGIGFAIAAYHYYYQRIGFLYQTIPCAADASCSTMYLGYWGFYSIPLMALFGFAAILVALAIKKNA